MARGKGKGPMGSRPDEETPDSESPSSSAQPHEEVEGSDFREDDNSTQSPSSSASEDQLQRTSFRGQRPATPLRPPTSQSILRLSQGERSTHIEVRHTQPAKRKGGASTSHPPSKKSSVGHTPSLQPGPSRTVPDVVPHVQRQEVRSEGGQPSRGRSVNVHDAGRYPSVDFFDKDAERSWETVQKRGIVPERRSTLKDDPRLPIRTHFDAVGWGPLLRPAGYYYPKLVRLFYCNMKRKDTKSGVIAIKSWLRGCRVRLTPDVLAASLHLQCEGTEWEFTNDQKKVTNLVSRSEIMATICSRDVANRQPKSRDLTPVARVLLNIVNTNILPKGGHREAVPIGYAFVIYCLIKGIRLSLPHLMISFMVYCTTDSKTAHTCPYPASITALLEKAGLDMKGLERADIRSKVDTATLARMGLKLPVDQREPLQVEASQATARTSAATSHHGEGVGHDEDAQGTGAADEATSRPPDLSRLREDVLAMKEQQAEMREQLTRIESSQVDMLHSLRMINSLVNRRRHTGSAPLFRGPPPAAYWAAPGVPRQSAPHHVGPSRLTIVPLEGDDRQGLQPGDVVLPFGDNEGDSDVEIVAPALGGNVASGGSDGLPEEDVVGQARYLPDEGNVAEAGQAPSHVGQDPIDPVDQAACATNEHPAEWTDVMAAGGQEAILDDPADIRIDIDCLLAGDFVEPDERGRQP